MEQNTIMFQNSICKAKGGGNKMLKRVRWSWHWKMTIWSLIYKNFKARTIRFFVTFKNPIICLWDPCYVIKALSEHHTSWKAPQIPRIQNCTSLSACCLLLIPLPENSHNLLSVPAILHLPVSFWRAETKSCYYFHLQPFSRGSAHTSISQ